MHQLVLSIKLSPFKGEAIWKSGGTCNRSDKFAHWFSTMCGVVCHSSILTGKKADVVISKLSPEATGF